MFRSPYMKLQTTRSKIQEPNKSEIPILKSEKISKDLKHTRISNLELIWFLGFGSWSLAG